MDKSIPTDTPKMPSSLNLSYDDAPEMRDMKVGDKVTFTVTGEIESVSKDNTSVKVSSIDMEEPQGEPTMEEAQTMPLDKLRKRLPKKSEE